MAVSRIPGGQGVGAPNAPTLDYPSSLEPSIRKARGAYYTPPFLVDLLLDALLNPLLADVANPLSLRICDPSCGDGHFLVPAARRLGLAVARRFGLSEGEATRLAVENCLVGADVDPEAISRCRDTLESNFGASGRLLVTDSLRHKWSQCFDLVLGNPPFLNAIENKADFETARMRKHRFPDLGGTADLAFYFLDLAESLRKPAGFTGFILPRAVLNARSAERLRQRLNLRFLHIPEKCDLFEGAAVFVCLVGVGPKGICAILEGGRIRYVAIEGANWWREGFGTADRGESDALGRRFEIVAGMTTSEAYACRSLLGESEDGPGLKLLTTGLIDPNQNLWGARPCRFLGRTMLYPRIVSEASGSLAHRIQRAKRPKAIVAGLSRRLECVLDLEGEYLPAVSTYCLFDPADCHANLQRACEFLNSEKATSLFVSELGANALGGGSITVTKPFLKALTWRE